MILHRPKTDLGGAPPAHPGKRVMRLPFVLLLIATPLTLVLALALTTTLLPRGLSHAAVSLPVEWVPGDVQNIRDLSGCHARQDATIKTTTPKLASQIRDQVNLVKEKSLSTPGFRLMSIWQTEVSGSNVVLEIETWYSRECPGPGASASQPGTGAEIQPASFQNAERQNAGLQRASVMEWVKTAVAGLAIAAMYTIILTVILGVVAAVAPEAVAAAVAGLAGCVAGAAASVVGAALSTGGWKESLSAGILGCTWGAILGPAVKAVTQLIQEDIATMMVRGAGYGLVGGEPWMGRAAARAALEAGVELQPVSDVLSTTGETVLRASQ